MLDRMVQLPRDMFLRRQWLKDAVEKGILMFMFKTKYYKSLSLHDDIVSYLHEEIVNKGTFYFYG